MKKQGFINSENVREAYVAPECKVIEMQNESFLCGSAVIEGSRFESFHYEDDYESVWN